MLTDAQMRTLLAISRYRMSCYENDLGNFIEPVVNQDETWVHHLDPEPKMQSIQWKHPGPSLIGN